MSDELDSAFGKFCDVDLSRFRHPVFIIGAPRTGSTLLFQAMLGQFSLSYISNAMALMPSLMTRFCKIWPRLAVNYDGNIRQSQYGFVPGMFSPNEAGRLCRKWFEEDGNEKDAICTMASLFSITRYPVLIKNIFNSNRLGNIRKIFPESRFIFIKRDPLFAAQSILIARKKIMGSYEQWWSIRPDGYRRVIGRSPFYQVLWQIQSIEDKILNDLKGEMITVCYEDFCQSPDLVLKTIEDEIGLQRRRDCLPLRSVKNSNRVSLEQEEWDVLMEYYHKYYEKKSNE